MYLRDAPIKRQLRRPLSRIYLHIHINTNKIYNKGAPITRQIRIAPSRR